MQKSVIDFVSNAPMSHVCAVARDSPLPIAHQEATVFFYGFGLLRIGDLTET